MTQDDSIKSLIRKIKLSPLGWFAAGIVVALFWNILLWISLIVVIGYLVAKMFKLDSGFQK